MLILGYAARRSSKYFSSVFPFVVLHLPPYINVPSSVSSKHNIFLQLDQCGWYTYVCLEYKNKSAFKKKKNTKKKPKTNKQTHNPPPPKTKQLSGECT